MRAACACLAAVPLSIAITSLASPPPGRAARAPGGAGAKAPAALASASSPRPNDREAARTFSSRGYELFQQGNWTEAIASFSKAEAIIHTPVHWLYIARCQARLGKLLAAKQAYRQILDEKLAVSAPSPFKDAQAQALVELGRLERQIPSMTVAVRVPTASTSLQVTLNAIPIAHEDLGRPMPVDPGRYTIVASAPGTRTVERTVQIRQGQRVEVVTIELEPQAPPPRESLGPPVIALTLGGLGLTAGVVSLGFVLAEGSGSSGGAADGLKAFSVLNFIGGGVSVAVGIAMLRSRGAPPPSPSSAKVSVAAPPALQALIGPSAIAIAGSF
jgi:hypothetical protein